MNQVQRDIERLLGLKQGSRSLYKFVVDYDNLRRKLAGSKLSELYSEEAMIEHLFQALSPSSQRSFPHGMTDLDKVINTLQEIAKLKGDMDGQEELPTALTNRRDNSSQVVVAGAEGLATRERTVLEMNCMCWE